MIAVLVLLNVAAFLMIPLVLVRKYLSTRDRGLLVLGVALVVWPLVAEILTALVMVEMDHLAADLPVVYPFSLFAQGTRPLGDLIAMLRLLGRLVSSALIVVGLSMLYQSGKFARPV